MSEKKSPTLKERGYRQVSLPIKLIEYVDKFIRDNPHLGYTSVPDFIRSAIREKMNL
ncbi:MAG: ribbon-helix-helix domain-containing protein [Candidatus Helarchaeota archaeon]